MKEKGNEVQSSGIICKTLCRLSSAVLLLRYMFADKEVLIIMLAGSSYQEFVSRG